MSGQLSFFAAGSEPVSPLDLGGLLCGPAQLVRRGAAARVSVVLSSDWRIEALLEAFGDRGLGAEAVRVSPVGALGEESSSVRTGFSPSLDTLARTWAVSGAGKRVPPDYLLGAAALRLWCIAALEPWEDGYALRLGERDDACWGPVGVALAQAGLPAVFVGQRGGGPAYRLSRRRRLRRLSELIGDPPAGAPADAWPR